MIDSVVFSFFGEDIPLTFNGDSYSATFTAPNDTSWFEPDHAFVGVVTATDIDGNKDSLSAKLRVLEQILPIVQILEPIDQWFFTDPAYNFAFNVIDIGSGITDITATIDGSEVEYTLVDNKYQSDGITTEGVHTLVVTATDNDGNVGTDTRQFATLDLITDRVSTDVSRVKMLSDRISSREASTEEKSEYLEPRTKGAYNATDLNRVGLACKYLYNVMISKGFDYPGYIELKTDWTMKDSPNIDQLDVYLQNVDRAKRIWEIKIDLPQTMAKLTYISANNIEKIFVNAMRIISITPSPVETTVFWASGEINSGEL